jgi:hypothetical protein
LRLFFILLPASGPERDRGQESLVPMTRHVIIPGIEFGCLTLLKILPGKLPGCFGIDMIETKGPAAMELSERLTGRYR